MTTRDEKELKRRWRQTCSRSKTGLGQKIKQTSRVTSSAAEFCGLAGCSSGFCAGGWFTTAAAWAAWRFWSAGTWTSRSAILTKPLRKIDRMALFIPSHLLLYVRGETAENSGEMLGSLKHKLQHCCFYLWPIPPFITSLPYQWQDNAFWWYPPNQKTKTKTKRGWPNNQAKFSNKSRGSDHDK